MLGVWTYPDQGHFYTFVGFKASCGNTRCGIKQCRLLIGQNCLHPVPLSLLDIDTNGRRQRCTKHIKHITPSTFRIVVWHTSGMCVTPQQCPQITNTKGEQSRSRGASVWQKMPWRKLHKVLAGNGIRGFAVKCCRLRWVAQYPS